MHYTRTHTHTVYAYVVFDAFSAAAPQRSSQRAAQPPARLGAYKPRSDEPREKYVGSRWLRWRGSRQSAKHRTVCSTGTRGRGVRVHVPGRPVPVQRSGRGSPSPGADVAGASAVSVQMWQGLARSRCRCGRGEPSPGADVAGVSPVPVQMWQGRRAKELTGARNCGLMHESTRDSTSA